jgi:thiamine biosynthesis lipoprotein
MNKMTKKSLSRRQFLQIVAVGGIAGATTQLSFDAWKRLETTSETRLLMGTVVNLTVVGDDVPRARTAIQACLNQMEDLEKVLSRFIPESQLSQLNRAGFLEKADPALLQVIAESLNISRLSDGAFDITIKPVLDALQAGRSPTELERAAIGFQNLHIAGSLLTFLTPGMSITLDGIAKGYIVDRGVEMLQAHGYENIMVEAGGDLMASGHRADGKAWKLGVVDPRSIGAFTYLTSFSVNNQAVATSGDYLQVYSEDKSQHHIIDPQTGYSPHDLASVTVLAPNAMLADAFSTTIMVLGAQTGLQFVNAMIGVEALMVTKNLEVYQTRNFPNL